MRCFLLFVLLWGLVFAKVNYHFLTILSECVSDHLEWFKWAPTIGGAKVHESNIAQVGFFYPFGTTQQTNISPVCWEEERFLFKGRICDHSISFPGWKRKRKTNCPFDFYPLLYLDILYQNLKIFLKWVGQPQPQPSVFYHDLHLRRSRDLCAPRWAPEVVQ